MLEEKGYFQKDVMPGRRWRMDGFREGVGIEVEANQSERIVISNELKLGMFATVSAPKRNRGSLREDVEAFFPRDCCPLLIVVVEGK